KIQCTICSRKKTNFPEALARRWGSPCGKYFCRTVQGEQPKSSATSSMLIASPSGESATAPRAASGYGQCCGQGCGFLCPPRTAPKPNGSALFSFWGKLPDWFRKFVRKQLHKRRNRDEQE